jgi:dihydroorotate dehydrogenase (NAD+) catalytic subunit
MQPIYDIHKTYLENAEQGPFFSGEIPHFEKSVNPVEFLGFKLNSPLGVAAGPLLNSKWIALAAKLGFDLPTYKTISSFAHPSHPLPNVIFVERLPGSKARKTECPADFTNLSITNSFGNPSMSPEFLMQDIEKANASLANGQVMIVSIFGRESSGISLVDDFVRAAVLAKEAGAKIIEANFSCPNVVKAEGCLYMSERTVSEFVRKIASAIRPIPLLIKVGVFPNREEMRKVMVAAATSGCAGIAGINTVSMEIIDENGKPALGPSRLTGGVCGGTIRNEALEFMKDALSIKKSEKLDLELLGCGGLMLPEHFEWMLDAGATIAMSATGMMWNPFLAMHYREYICETITHS